MSNESNREAARSIGPGELQASDFFPPGEGWNKDADASAQATPSAREACENGESATDGRRQH